MNIEPNNSWELYRFLQQHANLVRTDVYRLLHLIFNIRWLSTYHSVNRPLEVKDSTVMKHMLYALKHSILELLFLEQDYDF